MKKSSSPQAPRLSNRVLAAIAGGLALSVVLALTNPTTEDYASYVEGQVLRAVDRLDVSTPAQERAIIRAAFRSQGSKLIQGLILPHTLRRNWGLFSLFDTTVLETHVTVLGVGGVFVVLRGMEEITAKVTRLIL